MTAAVTKEGIEVKVGQVWKDLDVRMTTADGRPRTCTVIEVRHEGSNRPPSCHAIMGVDGADRTTRVRVNRMNKGATGWALVSQPVESEVAA